MKWQKQAAAAAIQEVSVSRRQETGYHFWGRWGHHAIKPSEATRPPDCPPCEAAPRWK